jgi:hypothetical protein
MSDTLCKSPAETFNNANECIQIKDPDAFFNAITSHLSAKTGIQFEFLGTHKCQYFHSREFHFRAPAATEIDSAIIKSDTYQRQSEVRAIWRSCTEIPGSDAIDLYIPELRNYCSLIDFTI